jgi:hypothetical protein
MKYDIIFLWESKRFFLNFVLFPACLWHHYPECVVGCYYTNRILKNGVLLLTERRIFMEGIPCGKLEKSG